MSNPSEAATIVLMRGTQAPPVTDRVPQAASLTPCAGADPELWFAERPAELHLAKALCGHCPIKADCLAGALDRREPWGVWGGEIVQHGVVLAYKRGRGRPSNADRKLGLVTKVAEFAPESGGAPGPDLGIRVRTRVAAGAGLTRPGTAGTFHSRSA